MRLVWRAAARPADLCYQNHNTFIEALTGFSYVHCPDGLDIIPLSQGSVLDCPLGAEKAGITYVPKDRGRD